MKSRLSSTIWTLVLLNGVVGFMVLGLAFSAGKKAGEASLFDFGSPAGGTVLVAIVLALATAVILNRAVAKVSKATSNQDANDALQRSITELLSVINQVARGDLSQRGKVTNDALGNVTDSINYMLDNF